jgi:hypothetical protein
MAITRLLQRRASLQLRQSVLDCRAVRLVSACCSCRGTFPTTRGLPRRVGSSKSASLLYNESGTLAICFNLAVRPSIRLQNTPFCFGNAVASVHSVMSFRAARITRLNPSRIPRCSNPALTFPKSHSQKPTQRCCPGRSAYPLSEPKCCLTTGFRHRSLSSPGTGCTWQPPSALVRGLSQAPALPADACAKAFTREYR